MEKKTVKKKTSAGKKASGKRLKEPPVGIKKQYIKSGANCKVTFRLPCDAASEAQSITVVGDFNNWSRDASPMKRLKNGDFTLVLDLEPGREYRFRYLINGIKWENDWCADRYEPNPFGAEDSIIVI
jgi:1,4-alpha-glucan branching enzyme